VTSFKISITPSITEVVGFVKHYCCIKTTLSFE
jgi:hypothetical protein